KRAFAFASEEASRIGPTAPVADPAPDPPAQANVQRSADEAKTCRNTSWDYIDGNCGGDKSRKARAARSVTDRPAIAGVAPGHNDAPREIPPPPSSTGPEKGPTAAPVNIEASPAPATASSAATTAEAPSVNEESPRPVAPKKPRKTVHSQSRPRHQEVRRQD